VIIAQRLVRLICKQCKVELPRDETDRIRQTFGDLVPDVLYHGAGCRACQNTGYRGRQGVFEMMAVTDDLRALILSRAPAYELRKVATRQGMRSLREDGWRLIRDGVTTADEVIRNTKDEEGGIKLAEIEPIAVEARV
jgi:type II secretory ATPase GspE/PulE/Tfp pilus assembly ATPase PilB-like protein